MNHSFVFDRNIKGFVSDTFPTSRRPRQGDLLSSLLFNLAFEPLLVLIQQSSAIRSVEISGLMKSIMLGL